MTTKVEIVNDGGVVEVDIDGQVSENVSIGAFDVEVLETNAGGLSTIFGASDTNFNSLADKDGLFYDIASRKWLSSIAYFEYVKTQNFVGLPVHMETLQQWIDHIYSSGRVHGLDLTDNLDGTINIESGVAIMRAVDDPHTTLYSVNVDGVSNLAFTNNQTNFVYAEYDVVSPAINVTLNPNDINLTTRVPLFVVVREDAHLTIYDVGEDSVDSNASLRKRFFYTEKFVRADGGSIIYDAGTFHIGCTAGEFYFGLTSFTFETFDTTGADTFEYYRLINGAWVETGESTINNTQYNDVSIGGSESLVALGSNKFAVHWVYLLGSTINPHFSVVYSQDEYTNLSNAEAATVPSSVPASIDGLGILLGRVIVREGDTEITAIESVFTTTFSPSLATDHNNLAGLQGGALDEYYHLTSSEHVGFQAGSLSSNVVDGATAVGFSFDSANAIVNNASKLFNFSSNGTDQLWLGNRGSKNNAFIGFGDGEAISNNFYVGHNESFTGYAGMFSDFGDFWLGNSGDETTYLNFFNGRSFSIGSGSNLQAIDEHISAAGHAIDWSDGAVALKGNGLDLEFSFQFLNTGVQLVDNRRSIYGTDKDAGIYYDGTDLIINPKFVGSGSLNILGELDIDEDLNLGADIGVDSVVGAKIGTATTQKLGFWNATPVVQPSGTGETVGFVQGAGSNVNDDSTFTGNIGSSAYRVNDIVKALKQAGILAS